jgi:TP901 family phage tail tape measure protein
MSDIESNININIDTSNALANLKALQRQISLFHTSMAKGGAATNAELARLQQNLINGINATGNFAASMQTVRTTTETFTNALEKNKLSMGEYFRYAGSQVGGFRRLFSSEFDTIEKVARERVKTLQTQYIKMGRDANGAMQAIAVRPLSLDMQNLGTQTAIAAQKQQIFNQLIKQGSTNLLNFGKNTQWAGRQLMVGFTIPLSIFGATAAREFMKIEEQTLKFQRVYGDMSTPIEETNKMADAIKNLSGEFTQYGIAVEKTMGLAADIAAMGEQGEDLLASVQETTRLSVLGGVEQQQALEAVTSLTNAFGVSTEQLSGKINFLNSVENQTITSIEDLTEAIPKAGPVVQQLGGDLEDLTFFLTAMREGGINASESANALKSGLASMINPTQEAKDMLMGLGINLEAIVNANRGNPSAFVVQFAQALDTLDPTDRARAIEQLFGKFQFARMSTLFQNVIAEGSQAQRVLGLTQATAEELAVLADREMKRISESPMYKFKKAWEDMKAALAPVGEQFLKAITPIIEFGTQILNKFNEMNDGAKSFVIILTTAVAGIGPVLLMTFGLIANGVANIIKAFAAMSNFFNRAGNSSQVLGEQTNYMTQQQLEAAAVAASLNQTHTQLTQTFTSEASAVKRLSAEYERAVAAQALMRGPIVSGGTTKRPKKYAKGVTMVPGNGNRDTEPAMLTPGEAVIPAPMVEKYGPLIEGMIAGSIPGYNGGTMSVGQAKDISGLYRAPSAIKAQTQKIVWDTLEAEIKAIEAAVKGAPGVTQSKINNLTQKQASHIAPDIQQMQAGGQNINVKNWKAGNLQADLGGINNYLNSLGENSKVLENFKSSHIDVAAKELGMSMAEVEKELDLLKKGIHPTTRSAGKVLQRVAATDPGYQGKAVSAAMGERLKGNYYETLAQRSYDPKKDEVVAKQVKTRIVKMQTLLNNAVSEGVNEAAQSKSPSQRAKKAGKNISDGTIIGINEGIDDAKRAGQRIGMAATSGMVSATGVAAGAQTVDENGNVIMAGGSQADQDDDKKKKPRSKFSKMAGKASAAGFIATGAVSAASMAGGPVGDIAGQLSGPLMAISSVGSLFTMMPPQIAAVVAAIALLVIAATALVDAFNKSRDAAIEQVKATQASKKSLQDFAEFSGKATAGEIRDKQREAQMATPGLGTGQNTFGASFLESDPGKAMAQSVQDALKKGGREAAQSDLTNQLANAVSSGVLTALEAKSIAANIAGELKDLDFGISVNGKLDELLGPNGENLKNDPINVRLKIQEQSRREMQKALNDLTLDGLIEDVDKVALGLSLTPFAPTQITGSIMLLVGQIERLGRVGGAAAAQMQTMFEVTQEQVDALELDYQKRIEIARAAGNITNAQELELELMQAKNKLIQEQSEATAELQMAYQSAGFMQQGAMTSGAIKSVEMAYKGTPEEELAKQAKDAIINQQGIGNSMEFILLGKLATKDISPVQFITLMEDFKDPQNLNKVLNTLVNLDAASADQVMYLMEQFGDNEEVKMKFNTMITTDANGKPLTAAETQEYIEQFANISQLQNVVDVKAVMTFYVENPEKFDQVQSKIDALNEMPDANFTAYANAVGLEELAGMNDLAAQFSSLPASESKDFVSNVLTIYETRGTPAFQKNLAAQNAAGFKGGKGTAMDFAIASATKSTNEAIRARNAAKTAKFNEEMAAYNESGGGGGGGGGGGEPIKVKTLDNILKKMRDLRSITTAVTDGWNASRNALDGMFGSGVAGFNGLQNQMRKLGAGEDLISLIAGMDPEEYERRKNELFNFDASGNITSFKQGLASIAAGLRAIALGEFNNKQEATIKSFNDQNVAIKKLVANGMSYADALKVVEDTELAAAIAREGNNETIKELIKNTEKATEATKALAAAQAVAGQNKDYVNQQKLLASLQENPLGLNSDAISAILEDSNLQTLYQDLLSNPSVDPQILEDALNNAMNKADTQLAIDKLTLPGMEKIFNDGFNKAMEAFSAQEEAITLEFNIKKKPFEDAIRLAQQSIEDLQSAPGGLDDLSAELERIGNEEADINKIYEERQKALDEIAAANEDIIELQRGQLSVADALSQGDIAAAARAAQELRAKQASQSISKQGDQLEKSRRAEIDKLTGKNGLNREQIEERIRKIKEQILAIEEDQLEPAQYQLTLLERQEQSQIDSLTVLGKTKEEWMKIKNNIDLARTSSDKYKKAMNEALGVVQDIVTEWGAIDSKEVKLDFKWNPLNTPESTIGSQGPGAEQTTPGSSGSAGDGPPVEPNLEEELTGDELFSIDNWFEDITESGWWKSLVAIKETIDELILKPLGEGFKVLWENISTWWNETVVPIWNDLAEAFFASPIGQFVTWFDTNIVQPIIALIKPLVDWFFADDSIENKKADIMRFLYDIQLKFLDFGIKLVDSIMPIAQGFDLLFGTNHAEKLAGWKEQAVSDMDEVKKKMEELPIAGAGAFDKLKENFATFEASAAGGLESIKANISSLPADTQAAILEELPKNFASAAEWANVDIGLIEEKIKGLPIETQNAIKTELLNNFTEFSKLANEELKITEQALNNLPQATEDAIRSKLPANFTTFRELANTDIQAVVSAMNLMPESTRNAIAQTLPANFAEMASKAGVDISGIETAISGIPDKTKTAITVGLPQNFNTFRNSANGDVLSVSEGLKGIPAQTKAPLEVDLAKQFAATSAKAQADMLGVQNKVKEIPGSLSSSMASVGSSGGAGFKGAVNKIFDDMRNFSVMGFKPFAGLPRLYAKGGIVPGRGNKDTESALLTPGEFVIRKDIVSRYGKEFFDNINRGQLAMSQVTGNMPTKAQIDQAFNRQIGLGQMRGPKFDTKDIKPGTIKDVQPQRAMSMDSVYNNTYSINVNAGGNANPNDIANAVMREIKRVDDQRIRGNRF